MFSLWDRESVGGRKFPIFIQGDEERCIEELGEIEFDNKSSRHRLLLTALHSQYRSVLGQVNGLQARTQYQACYRFSRCASASAGPTIADVRAL